MGAKKTGKIHPEKPHRREGRWDMVGGWEGREKDMDRREMTGKGGGDVVRSEKQIYSRETREIKHTHTFACTVFCTHSTGYIHETPNTHTLTQAIAWCVDTIRSWHNEKTGLQRNTNKFRDMKLAVVLHCTTPTQTPHFCHYTPWQHPSSDKRGLPAQIIGNQVSTLLGIVLHWSPWPEWVAKAGWA